MAVFSGAIVCMIIQTCTIRPDLILRLSGQLNPLQDASASAPDPTAHVFKGQQAKLLAAGTLQNIPQAQTPIITQNLE